MSNTNFENTNGLDDTTTNHLTTARDIAIMSAALLSYDIITKYSTIWMDTIRNGAFGLTNTNRLVRFYPGCTGLKTGSTSKAGFCMAASAKRDGLHLIAVIMGAATRDERNDSAKKLLDWGFANYSFASYPQEILPPIYVKAGKKDYLPIFAAEYDAVVGKGSSGKIERSIELPESLVAPIKEGDTVGYTVYKLNGTEIGRAPIVAAECVDKIGAWGMFIRLLGEWFGI
jgi:D-alanyl-D-alanine carboxypeptidase (penicillin-binding protein 5/6)